MKSRTIAIVVPYTKNKKILLQSRKSISKWGEEWSFWGGGQEPNESIDEAARREIKEELHLDVKELKYLGKLSKVQKRIKPPFDEVELTYEIFMTKVNDDLSQFTVDEGDGMDFFYINDARDLTMAPEIDSMTLDKIEEFFSKQQ